jgi:hypothetical protein
MEFRRNVKVTFTPEARALLGSIPTWNNSSPYAFPVSCCRGDAVRVPGCDAAFIVIGREWTLEDGSETIEVILDRWGDTPSLKLV